MIIRSKVVESNEWLFNEEVPDKYRYDNELIESRKTFDLNTLSMNLFQLSTSGLLILHIELQCEKIFHIHTEIEGEVITSQFIFLKQINKKNLYPISRHNIRYIPSDNSIHEIKSGIIYTYFIAVISKDYYLNLIKRDSLLHKHFVDEIEKGEYVSFGQEDLHATHEMQYTISELIESKKKGEIRRLHTESRIVELLMYQFEQYTENNNENNSFFNKTDILKLENVRKLLDDNFQSPPSQKELADVILVSESKLRKDFKEYFSITIHDYLTRIRMEKARLMLLEQKLSVYEVALLTGFRHQNNFSSAFKKYYGISPSEIKT